MEWVKYIKGGIWWCDLGKNGRDVMSYKHPVVIVSAVVNPQGPGSVTVLPISECKSAKEKNQLSDFYCIPINLECPSYICCNQLRTVTTLDLKEYIGQLTGQKLAEIDEEIARYLQMVVTKDYSYHDVFTKEVESDLLTDLVPKLADVTKKKSTKADGRCVPIYCVNENKWYATIGAAVEATGVSRPTISKILKDGCTRAGYLFKRAED